MSDAYTIETTDYGVRLSIRGFVSPEDLDTMNRDLERVVERQPDGFGVVMDMQASNAFSTRAAERVKSQMDLCREHGMERGAVILQSAIMALQARRIMAETGVLPKIRFIEASDGEDWESAAVAWAEQGEEPAAAVPTTPVETTG